jgi:hypothetical protein
MNIANFSAGTAKLHSAMETLALDWQTTKEFWNDETSRAVEENHLLPILKQLKETVEATARLSEVLGQAQRDCEPQESRS